MLIFVVSCSQKLYGHAFNNVTLVKKINREARIRDNALQYPESTVKAET